MNVDLDSINAGYTIRSDILGFYLCTVAEAEEADNGTSVSAGYDLRPHWEALEEAISALQNWKPEPSTSRRNPLTTSTARRPLMTDAVSRLAVHAQRRTTAATLTARRMSVAA